jgi:hypothetical protein
MLRSAAMANRRLAVELVVVLLVLIICAPSPQGGESNEGTISGLIKYGGTPPSPAPQAITKDLAVCGPSPSHGQSLVVGPDLGLANAVVTLADTEQGRPLKPLPAVSFDQKRCQYVPHVAVFPAGSTVVIINSDGILHNVHTESTVNPVIDLAQPGFKREVRRTIEKPEVIRITCDAHNWMEGWWYVTATPYYAISDRLGHYAIHNVPPGSHTVRVWQERLGTQEQRVAVKPGSATVLDFTFKPVRNQGS